MKWCVGAMLFLLTTGSAVAAAPLVPGDFAYGLSLPDAAPNALHAVTVPVSVYEKSLRPNLADLRVFDGTGNILPHAVRFAVEEQAQTKQSIPFFPLTGEHPPQATDLSLRVTRSTDGTVLNVDAGSHAVRGTATAAYLLDTTKLDTRPSGLELSWSHPVGLLTVSLSQSKDLTSWTPLVHRAVLADLDYNGAKVVTRRISLPKYSQPYIRLECIDCQEPMALQEINALTGPPVTADQWQWLSLQALRSREEQGERIVEYHLDAKIMVTALQLGLPTANSLLRGTIEARTKTDQPWHQVARSDYYRLVLEGKNLASPPVACSPMTATDWRLRIVADGAGLGGNGQLPTLEVGWRQQEILFLSRDHGPYTLAFGSAKAAESAPLANSLVLTALRDTKAETSIRRIEPGPLFTLRGDQALQSESPAISWKKVLLWTVLVAGVALLACMTRTILREMREKKN